MIRSAIAYLAFMLGLIFSLAEVHAEEWKPARLSDGQPDVQGFWKSQIQGTYSLTNPRNGGGGSPPAWYLAQLEGKQGPVKPSRIVDPADGEVPYQAWARERQRTIAAHIDAPDKPEFVDPQARCFEDGVSRTQWWHEFQIRQYPGYVVFLFDAATRIIPIGSTPHISPRIKLWMSDSRGHWEGNTLVVDVANSNSKHRLSNEGDFASDQVHIVERFTFLDANSYRYEATYDDPSVFTRPWTVASKQIRAHRDDPKFEFWEYACVEGERNAADIEKGE
ncbi:MAG TPA: hypothetical protein VKP60_13640 [Magnetospirillaceae bacterium]|nr:hypothetical protein [Magnetospirillaceae bacterium]